MISRSFKMHGEPGIILLFMMPNTPNQIKVGYTDPKRIPEQHAQFRRFHPYLDPR